jgi:hypothetical protein
MVPAQDVTLNIEAERHQARSPHRTTSEALPPLTALAQVLACGFKPHEAFKIIASCL